MNKNYETVSIDLARIEKLTEQVDSICALDIPADIPNGDKTVASGAGFPEN